MAEDSVGTLFIWYGWIFISLDVYSKQLVVCIDMHLKCLAKLDIFHAKKYFV